MCKRLDRFVQSEKDTMLGNALVDKYSGRSSKDKSLADCWLASRRVLSGQRHNRGQLATLAVVHRPTGPSQQVDQEHGKGLEVANNQTVRLELLANVGERDSIRHTSALGECWRRVGSVAGAHFAQIDVQAARS